MTASAKGPLDVKCEFCGARPGERCRTKDRLIGDWYPDRWQPHAARVRAARLRQKGTNG